MTSKDIRALLEEEAARFEKERRKGPPRKVGRPRAPADERGQVYPIRIPVARLEEVRRLALEHGMPPTAMLREWILDRLEREQSAIPSRGASRATESPAPYSRAKGKPTKARTATGAARKGAADEARGTRKAAAAAKPRKR